MDAQAWRRRFDAFAAKKTETALAASLPPYETRFEQPCDGMVAVGNEWTRSLFDGPFYLSRAGPRQSPRCSMVFVQSVDGNTGAARPADLGGGDTDAHVIYEGLSRVAADAVLSGADTVRGGGTVFSVWHPELVRLRASLGLPRHPVQMVATVRGVDLERLLLFNAPDVTAVVLTVPDGLARMRHSLRTRAWVTPIVMADRRELRRAFEECAGLGLHRISCIGGRGLAGSLLDAGLVDDLYLTTAPRPGGEPDTQLPPPALVGSVVVRKRGTLQEEGVVFEHRVLRRPN